jgi:23S rRNA (adenine2030-N6)-methyltransferase
VAVHLMDGYQSVKAFMPPKERRGLVLIDPPFEKEGEWKQILSTMEMGLKQFPSGVYAIWYPIKEHNKVALLHRGLKELNCKEVLIAELCIYPDDIPQGLPGCGLAIVNPPWKIAETLSPLVKWIWQRLSINNGGYSKVSWLKREIA